MFDNTLADNATQLRLDLNVTDTRPIYDIISDYLDRSLYIDIKEGLTDHKIRLLSKLIARLYTRDCIDNENEYKAGNNERIIVGSDLFYETLREIENIDLFRLHILENRPTLGNIPNFPKIVKQIASNLKKLYGFKLSEQHKEGIGNYIYTDLKDTVGTMKLTITSDLNTLGGFGDSGSCFRDGGQYENHRQAMQNSDSGNFYCVRVWKVTVPGERIAREARCWLLLDDNGALLFNGYSKSGKIKADTIANYLIEIMRKDGHKNMIMFPEYNEKNMSKPINFRLYSSKIYLNIGDQYFISTNDLLGKNNGKFEIDFDVYIEAMCHCDCCGDSFEDDDYLTYVSDGQYVCEYCLDNNYFYCEHCNEYCHDHDSAIVYDDNDDERYVCEDCRDNYYYHCEHCNDHYETTTEVIREMFSSRSNERIQTTTDYLCNSCVDDHASYCEHCSELWNIDDLISENDNLYCPDCHLEIFPDDNDNDDNDNDNDNV